jgi:site-specific DNA-methyltransferase (adenine-specific)
MNEIRAFRENPAATGDEISCFLDPSEILRVGALHNPYWSGEAGVLFSGDCLEILPDIRAEIVDTVFADPPFNLGKLYGKKTKDNLPEAKYLSWCKSWLKECIRILKPGGSLFVYNLPSWNIQLGAFLIDQDLTFRHWIAIEHKSTLPIEGRLYPAHYGLLYFSKGKPKTFRKIRTPILRCRHCGGEIRDYGGHRKAMNPNGVNLMDVWSDIPPVRHGKFKSDKRTANALSTKVLDRVVEMTTLPGEIVLDPFGGSGTTYAVARDKGRRWIGMDLDFADVIKDRLTLGTISPHANTDHVEGTDVGSGKGCSRLRCSGPGDREARVNGSVHGTRRSPPESSDKCPTKTTRKRGRSDSENH